MSKHTKDAARSRRSPLIASTKLALSYSRKSPSSQYRSNAAANRSRIAALSVCDSRTFHSSPSTTAACDRLDEPTNALENPEARCSSHALACSRVRLRS